jgi:hypothetical protein
LLRLIRIYSIQLKKLLFSLNLSTILEHPDAKLKTIAEAVWHNMGYILLAKETGI